MKVTRTRLAIAVSGIATLVAMFAGRDISPTSPAAPVTKLRSVARDAHESERADLIAALPQRSRFGKQHGDPFSPESWTPALPPPPAAVQAAPAPVPPPNPYRFAGALLHDGKLQTLITDGNRVYDVHSGDELNGGYRVEAVTADEVVLIYAPLGSRHPIAAKWAFSSEPTQAVAAASIGDSPPPLSPGSPLMAAADEPTPPGVAASPFPPGSPLTPSGVVSFASPAAN